MFVILCFFSKILINLPLKSVFHNHNHYKFKLGFGIMITYNDIYEALRKERYSEQLQTLPKKFVEEVSAYVSEKKKIASKEEEMFSEEIMKTKKQLENAISIFNELMLLRKKKILEFVFVASETGISKRDFENMMDFEKRLFDEIMDSVKKSDVALASRFNNGNAVKAPKLFSLILFLEDVEELVGLDGNKMGPFKKEEVSNVPKQIADILIGQKKAEVVGGE